MTNRGCYAAKGHAAKCIECGKAFTKRSPAQKTCNDGCGEDRAQRLSVEAAQRRAQKKAGLMVR